MSYIKDPNLEFLKKVSNEDLEQLFKILVYDKDGTERLTEELLDSEEYKKYGKNYSKYWQRIAEELQLFGGNTFSNMFRSHGVLYEEIVKDVADKLKIEINDITPENIENKILVKFFKENIKKKNSENITKIKEKLGLNEKDDIINKIESEIIKPDSYEFMLKLTEIMLEQQKDIDHRNGILKNIGIATIAYFTGGLSLIYNIMDPAFRVTIPAVVTIAILRKKIKNMEYKNIFKNFEI